MNSTPDPFTRDVELPSRFECIGHLGTGGMAEVLLVRDLSVEPTRLCAIKRMLSNIRNDELYLQHFRREARVASIIKHENVVTTYEVVEHNNALLIVMEYVDGSDLAAVIRASARADRLLDTSFALHIALEILAGLAAIHSAVDEQGQPLQVIHRDLNPKNILIRKDGVVKITDFGVSKTAGSSMTNASDLKGKVIYMAPEQIDQQRPVTIRSDIYAAALTIYETLTGVQPFRMPDFTNSMDAVLKNQFQPLSSLKPELPTNVCQVIDDALNGDPMKRPASAESFREQLVKAIEDTHVDNINVVSYLENLFNDAAVRDVLTHDGNDAVTVLRR